MALVLGDGGTPIPGWIKWREHRERRGARHVPIGQLGMRPGALNSLW